MLKYSRKKSQIGNFGLVNQEGRWQKVFRELRDSRIRRDDCTILWIRNIDAICTTQNYHPWGRRPKQNAWWWWWWWCWLRLEKASSCNFFQAGLTKIINRVWDLNTIKMICKQFFVSNSYFDVEFRHNISVQAETCIFCSPVDV